MSNRVLMASCVLVVIGATVLLAGSTRATTWRYAAFGDSTATGYLAGESYVDKYAAALEADYGVAIAIEMFAQNGQSSAQLLSLIQSNAPARSAIAQVQVVTWNIGLNDFRTARTSYKGKGCGGKDGQDCLRKMLTAFQTRIAGIAQQISSLQSPSALVRTMDIYYPWVSSDSATNSVADSKEPVQISGSDFQVLSYYLNQMNAEIHAVSTTRNIPVALVRDAINGPDGQLDPGVSGYLAVDGLHLNDSGQTLIAQLLRSIGQ